MNTISLLFLMELFAISCSKDDAVQNHAEGKGVPPKPGKLYAPPKSATKGLYDLS